MMTNNQTEDTAFNGRSQLEIIAATIFLLILIFMAISGNIAVILVVSYTRHLKEDVSSLLIVNLSVTDLVSGATVMMSSLIALIADKWTEEEEGLCAVICAMNYCLIIASMLTLCFISCDRYIAIIHPLNYISYVTKPRIIIAIIYTWFQAIVFSIVPVIFRWTRYDYWEIVCAIDWHQEKEQAVFYVIAAFLLCFFLPGIILAFNYSQIVREIRKQSVNVHPTTACRTSSAKYNTSSKAMRSLLIVVFMYFVCMTPFSVTKLVKVIMPDENFIPGWINSTASLIGYCSSAINPLIYGIFRKDFQRGYKMLLYKCFRQKITFDNHSTPKVENSVLPTVINSE